MTDQARTAKILRAFYSACSAYPEAPFRFRVREAARHARVSEDSVIAALETE